MSNTSNILSFCNEVEKFYFSPLVTLDYGLTTNDYLNLYAFIAKKSSTSNNVTYSPSWVKDVYRSLIYMKKLNLNDISPVIERIDWKANTYYDMYHHETALSTRHPDTGKLIYRYYVRNKYDQIFKCLSNNTNTEDSYNIITDFRGPGIVNNGYYYTINYDLGFPFEVGSYVTVMDVEPREYNGTYKVISSLRGTVDVMPGESGSYIPETTADYISGGKIKLAVLSTQEPIFDVGTFDEDSIVQTVDGYKWKYIYTLSKAAKLKFFNSDWMPAPINIETQNPALTDAGWGSIDVINIKNGGSGYANSTFSTNTVNVLITGDGTGATAETFVANGKITQISMTNKGSDYTYANVSLIPSSVYGSIGSGAIADLSISPIGGHGFNILREFYCRDVMVSSSFEGNENQRLPTDFSFDRIGLIYNPYLKSDSLVHANSAYISCTTDIVVSGGVSNFVSGETVYQGISIDNKNYSASVLSFDSANNLLRVINTEGNLRNNYDIKGLISNTTRAALSNNASSLYQPNSGDIFYLEEREEIERDAQGTEQLRILIRFS